MRSPDVESRGLNPSEICAYFDVPHPDARAGAVSRAKLAARNPVNKPSTRLRRLERDRELRLARQACEGWAARAEMISKAEIEALENRSACRSGIRR